MNTPNLSCWVLTEGMAGTENQCLGVAEALDIPFTVKKIHLKQPWKTLSPFLALENSWCFSPPLNPPWPDLLLAAGRKSIAASRYIKKMSGGKAFTVQIQDPRIDPAHFDLVAVPHHDPARGTNVITTDAAPNRITHAALEKAKEQFPHLGELPSPRIAVCIGGNSKAHKLTPHITKKLAFQLLSLDAHLMVTTSRRTGAENFTILQDALANTAHFFWDGTGDNPYHAMLAWADAIIVTADSVSMLSDAATTGKPVYKVDLEGGSARFDRFHNHLTQKGILKTFTGAFETWSYTPLHDSQKIAQEITKALKGRMPAMQEEALRPASSPLGSGSSLAS